MKKIRQKQMLNVKVAYDRNMHWNHMVDYLPNMLDISREEDMHWSEEGKDTTQGKRSEAPTEVPEHGNEEPKLHVVTEDDKGVLPFF